MIFKLGELFCGPGGLAWGATHADIGDPNSKIIHEWATDYDFNTCKTYTRNICPNKPESVYCEDVRHLDFKKLSPIDALAFGFPCNDFSSVGARKGLNGTYGPLYTYCVKALKLFRPLWFLAENVSGLTASDKGMAYVTILNEFRFAGYKVYPHLYKFEEYGIPQARHRVIIVGIRDDLHYVFHHPSNTGYPIVSCKDAIDHPPIDSDAPNHTFIKQTDIVTERLKHIKPGENAFTANLPDHLKLRRNGPAFSQVYKRLDPEKPAYTITGSGGGGTHVYHWSEPRSLTNRERARLQTFPDDFVFEGGQGSVRKQIGMAVPCLGAKIIFEAILKTFAGITYE